MSASPGWSLHPTSWRRRWRAAPGRQTRLDRPVVSVGNLAMGGRGKTPLVAHLARMLLAAGERPAILSRGYGRARVSDDVVVVSDGRHLLADLDRAGDEPLMLARDLPGTAVVVCPDRARAGAHAEAQLGVTVHLLDDGFQHLGLHRDVDIVVVTPDDLEGRPVPAGRLRESTQALALADVVVVDAGDADMPDVSMRAGTARVVRLRRQAGDAQPLDVCTPWPPPTRDAVVAAGIVEPARLAASARALGWTVRHVAGFPDHHRYTARDLQALASAVASSGASVVLTTAKDAVRLRPLRPLPCAFGVVPLSVSLEPAGEVEGWLLERIAAGRTG